MRAIPLPLTLALLLCGCGQPWDARADSRADGGTQSTAAPFTRTQVADFDAPWAMAFLPGGEMLVTEKAGQLKAVSPDGRIVQLVTGTPKVDSAGQGALMDVVPAPDFAKSQRLYLSWSEAGEGGKGVVLATATLARDGEEGSPRLKDLKPIFRAAPLVSGNGHYSGRIAFAPDGQHLFFTAGERQAFTPAQDPRATLGKVLRLNLDGTAAAGNPLAAKGFHPAVWSYGHRNLLGIAFDAKGRLWEQEMGPKGGDEINLIQPGRNYGWPNASNGSHYDGRDIPDHKAGDGYEAPKLWWNPSISPGGLLYYDGAMFPAWKGSLFLGALSGKALIRVALDGEAARKANQWDMGFRVRDVEQGPDGALWVLEDGGQGSQGRLWKLTPPEK
ncbi:PQQ-dependent sugar dehydrogenase [Sphingobium sufflavum]|uniref:PQQ-dependent sugar dehydrogenase n=1 Tax=Sphingobium sufflavum TaxID=1129547 RepID=UPI001F47C987|nr:PQQ-dependent sugar dehydrogenase [Sphingobium sufflavum]MCE7797607.1 PQQ-dependent sugar dehydrogenase [Sphingobium sufflavum]